MPRIYVEWVAGRSKEVQNALAKKLTEAAVEVVPGTKPDGVRIVFRENAKEDIYKGGIPFSEL